jgi:hypothetical protein
VDYRILFLGQLNRVLVRVGTPPPGNHRAYPHLGSVGFMLDEIRRTADDLLPRLQEAVEDGLVIRTPEEHGPNPGPVQAVHGELIRSLAKVRADEDLTQRRVARLEVLDGPQIHADAIVFWLKHTHERKLGIEEPVKERAIAPHRAAENQAQVRVGVD